MQQSRRLRLPRTKIEVEIVLGVGDGSVGICGSLRSCSLLFPRQVCAEGSSPGFAAVVGVRLFVAMGIWSNVRPHRANQDRLVVEGVTREKLALPILERANQRRVQNAHLAVDERLAPLMGLRVVETEG